ncbi:hypothetical protein CQW23_34431 [Capsicum baccatum]|uniref:peptidylprolyl isomerase n=1 Tax=Capsicum baccatum TaxID=33114 RepID=A0A2G2UYW8_CAPBA|nr:hypothetical protein CQW23_34431 [Capsicum baccatum]
MKKKEGSFHSTRGLKQGDPLSPALFSLGAEVLSRMPNNLHQKPLYQGFTMQQKGPQVNNLSFADDVIIFTSGKRTTLKLQQMYRIRSFEFVFQRGMPLELKKSHETEKTVEEINDILRQGRVKNSGGTEWGHQGFGRIRRDLVFRLAYPIAPIDIKAEPEKVEVAAPVSKIKNTKPHRSKRSGSTSKTSQHKASGQTQSGVGGKRFGTEAGRKRTHPTHSDIDDINEAKKRCKTNALWGVELKPGKPFTLYFEKERGRLHVSQATLSTGSTSMTSIVQCQVGDKKAICICSLLPEKQERCLLNLEFEEDHEDITFLVIGSHSVHLSGFFYGESEDCFGDEYASDPYEEGAAEIDSESSDSIKFEDVAEDGDKDGSTDDAFKILEEEESRDESGTLKRPKKKKHNLNVTDEEENLIVIKGNTDSPLSESEDDDGVSLHESKSKSVTSKKSDGIEDEDTHEGALNEKARGTDVDERKGLQRIVCEDTSKTYDYQRGASTEDGSGKDGSTNELEIGSYVEQVTGFKKALLGPRLLEAERLKKKSSPSTDEEKKEMSLVPYSYAVGSLMYAMVCTRPDIARKMKSKSMEPEPHNLIHSLCQFSATLHSLCRHDRENSQCPDKRRDQLTESITESSQKSGKHHKEGLLVHALQLDVYARYRFPQLAHGSRLQGDNKRYVFEEIVNVNASYAAPARTWYYITFDARDTTVDATAADAIKTFQANVWHGLFDGIAEVSLCRLKKILSNEDKKKNKKKKKSQHNGKQEVEQDKPSLVESFDSGLVIEELSKGKPRGRKAFVGFKVAVRYTGKLMENDKIFYNNMGEGGEPFEFRLGMRVGDKRRITIPPDLGYGDQGHGGVIPPDSWLVIEVELMSVDGIEDEDTHEKALNEKARGTDVDERKGLQRIVCDDTSKTYDYQSIGEQIKQKKVMDGAHPEHVEANDEPIDDDFSFLSSRLQFFIPILNTIDTIRLDT